MKPSFALSFTEDSIQLLHRVGKGWVNIGETLFEAPDLDEALDYMRRAALGLEPEGVFTKLVIPNSQIRYLEIDAPGPSDEERIAQIRVGLEGKTPYPVEDLVFDWSGKGKLVRVAVLARETLDEAESFATTRGFNPVSFVSIPDYGDFNGEPYFGLTGASVNYIPPGDELERDRGAIRIFSRGNTASRATPFVETEQEVAAEAEAEAAAYTAEDVAAEPVVAPEVEAPSQPELDLTATELPQAETAPAVSLAEATASEEALSSPPAPEPEDLQISEALVDDWRAPSFAAPLSSAEAEAEAEIASDPVEAAPAAPVEAPPVVEAPVEATVENPAAAEPEVEEAPFTYVHDDSPDDGDADDRPPASSLKASTGYDAPAPDPLSDPLTGDDMPPPPSAAAMGAFASRRSADGLSRAPSLGAAARPDPNALARAARGKPVEELPPMPRPPQAGTRPSVTVTKASAGKTIGGLVGAPGLGGGRKAGKAKPTTAAQPSAAARIAAAITAATPGAASPGDAAKSLTRPGGTFGMGPPAKQRSRAPLFLTLVAILLACIALVAAWSTLYLASGTDDSTPAVEYAIGDTPGIDDEMLADGEADLIGSDPAGSELADGNSAEAAAATDAGASTETDPAAAGDSEASAEATAVPDAEAAPGTAVSSDSPPLPALSENQDEIFLATSDTPPPALDALALPQPVSAEDGLPADQMPPPPFGTVYAFDEQGLLKPTPEGIVSPEGVMLIAGKPSRLPPSRSETATAAAAAAALVAAPAEDAALTATTAADGSAGAIAPVAAAGAEAQPVGPEAQPNPELATRKPKLRPASLETPTTPEGQDDAGLTQEEGVQQASLRPRTRPGTILAAADAAREQTEAASLALQPNAEEAAQAEAELAAAAAAEAANPSVVAISRRPAARPKDFSRAVEAAVAAAIRTPEPEPEPEPVAVAAAKPSKGATSEEDDGEPEIVAKAAPKIPSSASVAKQATYKNAISMSKLNLIGIYGTPSNRHALVRQPNGKYRKVSVGDKVDGGKVQAITQTELRYQKGGRLISLAMPKS